MIRQTPERLSAERIGPPAPLTFEDLGLGVVRTGPSGELLGATDRYCEIVGRTRGELLHARLEDLAHPEDLELHRERHAAMAAEGHLVSIEERCLRPTGQIVWTRSLVLPRHGMGGVGAIAVVEEITDRKRADRDRELTLERERRSREEAEAASQGKDEILALLSHELRTPLTAILGWLRLLHVGALDPSGRAKALDTIERNATVLARLVGDLLDVSRVLSGTPGLDAGASDTALVRAAVALQSSPATAAHRERDHSAREAARRFALDRLPSLGGAKILIVDDEADARDLLVEILTRCGAVVRACASAKEARAVLDEWHPDVLISDIGMPEESGVSLIQSVRALPAERGGGVPAIALTGYTRVANRLEALAAGYDIHLAKPVDPAELVLLVANTLGRQPDGPLWSPPGEDAGPGTGAGTPPSTTRHA